LRADGEIHIAAPSPANRVIYIRYWDRTEGDMASIGLEMARQEPLKSLKAKINEAWDDPRPSLTADEVFDQLE
jgi:hypothetical protein